MSAPVPYNLRDYQIDVTARAQARVKEGCRRVLIQGATGSGKSIEACYLLARCFAKGKRAVFGVHRRRIIKQIDKTLDRFGVPHGIIMGSERLRPAPVQVACRDTLLSRCIRNDHMGLPPADLLIIDEAHNSGYERILERYPNAVIIGMTATPAMKDGRGLYGWQALECTVPTSQLVQEGHLVSVRCYAPERMGSARKRGKKVKGLAGDPVTWWKKLGEDRPTIVFAKDVASSQGVVQAFNRAGIPAAHVDGTMDDAERDAITDKVESGVIRVLSNCSVFTEGADIPCLSCLILLRSAESYVLYAQACGRIMRPHPDKKDAVLIDHSGAVYRHGFPDEDVEWSLDASETVDQRIQRDKKDGKRRDPIVCPQCSNVFSGAIRCPACGHVLPKKLRPYQGRDELLTPVDRELEPARREEEKVRYWFTALRVMANKGRSLSAARCMWKGRYKEWPPATLPHNDFDFADWQRPVTELLPQFAPKARTA